MSAPIQINVYRDGGEWFAARWIGGEYDGCDALDLDGDATEAEALGAAREMPLTVDGVRTVTLVPDAPDYDADPPEVLRGDYERDRAKDRALMGDDR